MVPNFSLSRLIYCGLGVAVQEATATFWWVVYSCSPRGLKTNTSYSSKTRTQETRRVTHTDSRDFTTTCLVSPSPSGIRSTRGLSLRGVTFRGSTQTASGGYAPESRMHLPMGPFAAFRDGEGIPSSSPSSCLECIPLHTKPITKLIILSCQGHIRGWETPPIGVTRTSRQVLGPFSIAVVVSSGFVDTRSVVYRREIGERIFQLVDTHKPVGNRVPSRPVQGLNGNGKSLKFESPKNSYTRARLV